MSERHIILGGKVQIYRRSEGGIWHCSASVGKNQHRTTTGEESLAQAKAFAEDWYLGLRAKLRTGELSQPKKKEKTFREAAEMFEREFKAINEGQRSAKYLDLHCQTLRRHVVPYFGDMGLSEITPGKVQEYRIQRREGAIEKRGAAPARSTIHKEIVALRQTLKAAQRHGWMQYLPDLSEPYKASGKISHRAWFSPEEYKQLYTATRERAAKPQNPRFKWESEQLHDFVLFMANTGLRPDEVKRLQFRDVSIVKDDATNQTILEIEVRGKRGVGYCKSTPGAVKPFERLRERPRKAGSIKEQDQWKRPELTELLFPGDHREIFNAVLNELGLKTDRDGQQRAGYSLRHTYICLRLMEGADIYQVAKNCRTSVEMIEKFYAAHIKDRIDAAAINVRKKKPKNATAKAKQEAAAEQITETTVLAAAE